MKNITRCLFIFSLATLVVFSQNASANPDLEGHTRVLECHNLETGARASFSITEFDRRLYISTQTAGRPTRQPLAWDWRSGEEVLPGSKELRPGQVHRFATKDSFDRAQIFVPGGAAYLEIKSYNGFYSRTAKLVLSRTEYICRTSPKSSHEALRRIHSCQVPPSLRRWL